MRQLASEVLIVGAGPTGMVAALHLDLLGISSTVVERRKAISKHPKAHELSARSIEILLQLGINIEELKKEASPHEDASRILFGHTINETFGEIDLLSGGNDAKYEEHLALAEPYLNLSQTSLEEVLREKLLSSKKVELLIEHSWNGMEQSSDRVVSSVKEASGKEISIESQYVICADGAGSRTRADLGIEMIGAQKLDDFVSVYFEHNLRNFVQKPGKLYWILNPKAPGTFIAHHIECRWVYHFPIQTPYEKPEQFTDEVVRGRILEALGDASLPINIHSVSVWRMTRQIAATFSKGRAFLAGDAAHRFPPTGGLGMNSGIGDAHNLCWKLAMVIQKKAGDELLATYEQERRAVLEINSAKSEQNYHKIMEVPKAVGLNPAMLKVQAKVLNSTLMKLLPKDMVSNRLNRIHEGLSRKIRREIESPRRLEKIQKVVADQVEHFDRIGLDLGYAYEQGCIVRGASDLLPEQEVSSYRPSIEPGVRFPHFWVGEGRKKTSSHDWLSSAYFTLLCNQEGEKWWSEKSEGTKLGFFAEIVVKNVEASMVAVQSTVAAYYNIATTPLLLIRPDGHVAWKPQSLEVELSSIFNQLKLKE